ncbi:hypothetical protein OS493_039071 [Desmophyllum pertusum]|uniref:Uncharacterized protein n=1 Tax=Desmophyllum pertusum TaxID=174260 RepID=A0A9X0D113_9CNID|nr:hypothetical protein OS493_039071 [Desmophyllum pertusum]
MAPADSEDGLMIDRTSALVGMARLRQLRVLDDTCSDIPIIRYLARGCYGLYTMEDEETNIYQPEWLPVPPNIPIENISYDMCPRPWRYHTATKLKGVPLWGETTIYSGGGYVAELGYYRSKAFEVITELAHHKWIDRRTRGVFVELTVYNAQVNLFSVISLLAEAMPTGGVVTFRRIDTIRVYRYIGELANVALAAELIIALVILFLLYKVIKRLYHQRLAFFKKFWNLVDLLQVLFALVSIALYFVKMVNINATMKDLSENPFVFVSFSLLLTWNEIDTYMIAFVVFLTTIKFLYLLRYNNHIRLLNKTFSNMRKEILLFMVQFMFWFLPFVLMAHIAFGAHLQDFISYPSAFQAMLNALLGASYFQDLQQVDRIIGPALFLSYSLLMELILLNMFVSIINEAFGSRETEIGNPETDPELVEFILKRLKGVLGLNLLSTTVTPERNEKWYVDDSSDEENDHRMISTKISFNVLDRKLESLQNKFRKVSVMEEEEDNILLEMILIREPSFAKVCPTELATITCYNDSKIFIESVLYGRADNVTCLAPNQTIPSCSESIDLSWRVTPYCQGLPYCVINGTYDVQEKPPCDGNNANYFNIAYSCKTINYTEIDEKQSATFLCPVGKYSFSTDSNGEE